MTRRSSVSMMTRSTRVFVDDTNTGKLGVLHSFVVKCSDVQRFFVDQRWAQKDFTGKMPPISDVRNGNARFDVPTRLGQPCAKQAAELVRSQHKKKLKTKPVLKRNTVTLFSGHQVDVEKFDKPHFDMCLNFRNGGAPKIVVPFNSHAHLNKLVDNGWVLSNTVRFGIKKGRVFCDLIFKKPKPAPAVGGRTVAMDSNYKAGFVFSDGQKTGTDIYDHIQTISRRTARSHKHTKQLTDIAAKQVDLTGVSTIVIEDLNKVKSGKRGTFPRQFNRRLSHWQYAHFRARLEQKCEQAGVRIHLVDPAYTSQFCRTCKKWDRRNRNGDMFKCRTCVNPPVLNSDENAAQNILFVAVSGVYGLRYLTGAGPSDWAKTNPRKPTRVRTRKKVTRTRLLT